MLVQKRGQSTLEYILILTAIIAAIIIVAAKVQQRVETSLEHASNQTLIEVQKINYSGN